MDGIVEPMNPKSDGELLEEFCSKGSESPFEELVRRHGGMVFAVCRRITGNEQDAEEAVQAVFLTLAGRAKSLRRPGSLGGWLYRVARFVSLRKRESETLRKTREKEAGMTTEPMTHDAGHHHKEELKRLLDDELDALPEKYRVPIILHHLEEKTVEEAARLLGLSVGTVAAQVSRGRLLLQKRFARRGVVLSGAALGAFLSENAAAAMPDAFITSTTKAATGIGTSSQVAALTHGTIKALFMQKLQTALIGSVIFAGIAAGTGIFTYRGLSEKQPLMAEKHITTNPQNERKNISTEIVSRPNQPQKTGPMESVKKSSPVQPENNSNSVAVDESKKREEQLAALKYAGLKNLRQVGVACRVYAIDHNNRFPNRLSELADYLKPGEAFLSPGDPNPIKTLTLENLDENSSYILVKNLSEDADVDQPVVIEKSGHYGEGEKGGNVFFAGGHCAWVKNVEEYIQKYVQKIDSQPSNTGK